MPVTGICSECYADVDVHSMSHCPQCGADLHPKWPFTAEETQEMLEEMRQQYYKKTSEGS